MMPDAWPGEIRTAAVVGLGLVGGSLARDLAARGVRVLGCDRDAGAVAAALREEVLAGVLDDTLAAAAEADLVVLAVPVREVPRLAAAAVRQAVRARLVMDVASTKAAVVNAVEAAGLGATFVGAHPLAGGHRSGWAASRADLFRGARVFVCPTPSATADAVALALAVWAALGSVPETIDAAEHDRLLAWTSHLPQLLATAFGLTLADAAIPHHELGPGGRDVARLAGSSPDMWTGIAATNADNLVPALEAMERRLRMLREVALRRDEAALERAFREAAAWHAAG
jgi:prephenate dehydrogenase